MSSPKLYAYINDGVRFNLTGEVVKVSQQEQRDELLAKFELQGFAYVFAEDHGNTGHVLQASASRTPALDLLLQTLRKGDEVWVHSTATLINEKRIDWLFVDVLDFIRKIHEAECSVRFLVEALDTKSADGRYILRSTLSAMQYQQDKLADAKLAAKTSSRCSSSSACASK